MPPDKQSPHDRYRERLARLTDDTALGHAIAAAGREHDWWPADRTWVRTRARFTPDREPFAALVFQSDGDPQRLCEVEVFETRPERPGGSTALSFDDEAGWLGVTPFPADPALPRLSDVLAQPGRPTVVRYLPRRQCTIRFDRADGGSHFAKSFRYDSAQRTHVHGLALWEARDEMDFVVARPLRWDLNTRTVWQEAIPGVPVSALHLGHVGASLGARMGRAAASLTRASVTPSVVYDLAAHLGRSVRYSHDLVAMVPRLEPIVDALMDMFARAHADVKTHPLRPIHGSLSRTQWVDGTSHLGLVDFDKLAVGDPEFDVAALLTELDYDRIQVDAIKSAFLSAYESVAGPLDRDLLDIYAAHERLEKAVKAARAVRPDGDARAEHHLMAALADDADLWNAT